MATITKITFADWAAGQVRTGRKFEGVEHTYATYEKETANLHKICSRCEKPMLFGQLTIMQNNVPTHAHC